MFLIRVPFFSTYVYIISLPFSNTYKAAAKSTKFFFFFLKRVALSLGLFSNIKLNNSNESILERRQVYICVVWTSKVTAYDISTLLVSKPSLDLVYNKLNWSSRFHSWSNPCTSRPDRMQQLTSDISYFNRITVAAFLR